MLLGHKRALAHRHQRQSPQWRQRAQRMKRYLLAGLAVAAPARRPQQSRSQASRGRARPETQGAEAMGCWAGWAPLVMAEVGLAVVVAPVVASMWVKVAQAMPVRAVTAVAVPVAVAEARLVGVMTSMAQGTERLVPYTCQEDHCSRLLCSGWGARRRRASEFHI